MRLLWVWVLVGVAGGVAKEEGRLLTLQEIDELRFTYPTAEEERRREACWREEEAELCIDGFLFTATALKEVRSGGELDVTLTLEKSLHPHVTFDLSLRTLGDRDLKGLKRRGDEEEWPEEKVLAREEVILGVNELRRVELRVSDLPWRTAYLVVTALQAGYVERGKHIYTKIQKVTSDVQVFVQTEKAKFAPGDTVDFRAVVVDGNVDKTPKFAQVILKPNSKRREEVRLPWVEVPQSGILRGNFTFDRLTKVSVRVTSNVTSSDSSMATSPTLDVSRIYSSSSQVMSAKFEVVSDVFLSQPRLKGRVKLTSPEGLPLDGSCKVKICRSTFGIRVAVGLAGGEFEFDVVREMGAQWAEEEELYLQARCIDLHSGSVDEATKAIRLWRSPLKVTWLPVGGAPKNSSHPQTTVAFKFLVERMDGGSVERMDGGSVERMDGGSVERMDGGSVEEEESKKGLQVRLLLSEENLKRLRPSATNFSVPIPPSGKVRLEFQVNEPLPVRWIDRIVLTLGDAGEEVRLRESSHRWLQNIHVTLKDPARLIRRGDVVRFRVRSCVPYDNVNVILSSHKAIYSSRRFSFSPEGEELDEVIELTLPQNGTEGTLNFLVYGHNPNPHEKFKIGYSASITVDVVPPSGPQSITIVDQVDVDMSTIVTFRLEGMLPDSVVSLQAAKDERPLNLHENRNRECENLQVEVWDYSAGLLDPNEVEISANFVVKPLKSLYRRPPLVFFDFDRKTSTDGNGTLTVTKTFDRLTEFGAYVVSGATLNSKSGRTVFSNSPVLEISPPPVTLSVSVAPSVLLGKTVEFLGYVRNNLATPYEGHVTLETREGGSTEVREEFVKVNPNGFEVLKMNVTPQMVGDLFVSLKSNISSRLAATKKVSVTPLN